MWKFLINLQIFLQENMIQFQVGWIDLNILNMMIFMKRKKNKNKKEKSNLMFFPFNLKEDDDGWLIKKIKKKDH